MICSRILLFINLFIYFNDYYFINFNYLSNELFEISIPLREVICCCIITYMYVRTVMYKLHSQSLVSL